MSEITPEYLMKLFAIIERDGVATFTPKQIGGMVFDITQAYLKLHEENQRLREALEKIAEQFGSLDYEEMIEKARDALKE